MFNIQIIYSKKWPTFFSLLTLDELDDIDVLSRLTCVVSVVLETRDFFLSAEESLRLFRLGSFLAAGKLRTVLIDILNAGIRFISGLACIEIKLEKKVAAIYSFGQCGIYQFGIVVFAINAVGDVFFRHTMILA